MAMPYAVCLTGGIAAGKSSVEQRFATLGIQVCDADRAARAVVAPGTEGLGLIVERFGASVLDQTGHLDRAAMRERVFTDVLARRQLEAIVHPRVRQWLLDCLRRATSPYALVSIPLLAENIDHYRWVQRIVVVDAPEDIQRQRLMSRDGSSPELVERILASQANRSQRLALADDVIDNSGSEQALDAQVAALHQRYLTLAATAR